jgi:xanthine/CO dehydrogenase XdhC/CoxF family maturation factor
MENLYELVADAVAQGHSVALATLVHVEGSTPREVGAKMVVYPNGHTVGTVGGGAMEAAVIREAVEAIGRAAWRVRGGFCRRGGAQADVARRRSWARGHPCR